MYNTLARNIRQQRQAAGLSQEVLAELSGLSQTWISRLEQGDANPTMETLTSLAQALEIDVAALLTERAV